MDRAPGQVRSIDGQRPHAHEVDLDPRVAAGRDELGPIAVPQPQMDPLGVTEHARVLGDRIEDRPEVARRLADHLEDLGRRGLMLERLLRLVEEARVLDRDHRLVGERVDQTQLRIGEWLGPLPPQADDPHRLFLSEQGHGDAAPCLAKRSRPLPQGTDLRVRRGTVVGIVHDVDRHGRASVDHRPRVHRPFPQARRVLFQLAHVLGLCRPVSRDHVEELTIEAVDVSVLGCA